MNNQVLCLLMPGFEEIETITPVDVLRRAKVEVTLASLSGEQLVTGRTGVVVQAEAALADVNPAEYSLLLIPGGPGVKLLRLDQRPAQLAREFVQAGKPVGAICAAPLVLADAGLLAGKRFTAHFSTREELPQALGQERVVVDGLLITSRGAGTALDFGLALVRQLCGEAAAREVSQAIMA
jgi:4-methyl-5(b-hydroxyethyl)-thiazole monophosphate biosynthesis